LTLGRVRLPGPPIEADLSEHLPFTFIGDEAFKLIQDVQRARETKETALATLYSDD
jgi:hypothetical protein